MQEVVCESSGKCDNDQVSFKAYLSRWLAASTKMAPFTYDAVMTKLSTSATAAAAQCSGGDESRTCGTKWTVGTAWDGTSGVGQQMSALEVIQSNLIGQATGPVTNTTGGTSVGNSNAGGDSDTLSDLNGSPTTAGDRAGAGILTALILVSVVGGAWWISTE
jgi:mannan endo-1,6-alpha-mannosidase